MAESMFEEGDKVQPFRDAQDLKVGQTYIVTHVTAHPYGIFGTAYVYTVVGEDQLGHDIINGHLLLTKVG
jgi:hypothetical protein